MPQQPSLWNESAGGFFVEESLIIPSVQSQQGEESFARSAQAVTAAPPDRTPSFFYWRKLVSVIWLLGMGVTLLPVTVSLVYSDILGKSARPVVDTESTRLLRELCEGLGVRRQVRLLETGRSLVPMTWGLLHAHPASVRRGSNTRTSTQTDPSHSVSCRTCPSRVV
jgi:hypothetical protein